MPTWLKVVLGIVAALFLILAALAFLGYRWVKTHASDLKADAAKIKAEAAAFARDKDADACIGESAPACRSATRSSPPPSGRSTSARAAAARTISAARA
jgi:hypothetical protein